MLRTFFELQILIAFANRSSPSLEYENDSTGRTFFGVEQLPDISWCGQHTGHILVWTTYRTFLVWTTYRTYIGVDHIPDIFGVELIPDIFSVDHMPDIIYRHVDHMPDIYWCGPHTGHFWCGPHTGHILVWTTYRTFLEWNTYWRRRPESRTVPRVARQPST